MQRETMSRRESGAGKTPWMVVFSHPTDFPGADGRGGPDLGAVLERLGCDVAPIPEHDPYDPDQVTDVRRLQLLDPTGVLRGDLTWSTRSGFGEEDLYYLVAAIVRPEL